MRFSVLFSTLIPKVRALKVLLCLSIVLALFAGTYRTTRADTGNNWTGAYYNNQTLSGAPVFTRVDPAIVFNWGPYGPGPGIGGEHWSARWNSVQFLNAGTYRFNVTADDGVRIYIDGQIVIDAWRDESPTTYYANVQVVSGTHIIQVDYYQGIGDASLSVSWDFLNTISTQWIAQYFNNPYLQGAAVVTRYENAINYDWGYGSPDPAVPFDYFSARWTASLPFSAATYRFTMTVDNGLRLFIDDLPVVNQWQVAAPTTYVIDVPLAAGIHTLRVEYFSWAGPSLAQISYNVAIGPPPLQNQTWYGEYFSNPNLQGAPSLVRDDGASGINFNWTNTTPTNNIGHDNYSVRWTRQLYFPGRPYTFYLTVDDGARLFIDNNLIIDSWQTQAVKTIRQNVDLTEGPHTLRLEYFQATGNAVISLTWDPPNGQNPPLPPGGGVFVPPPTSNAGVMALVTTDALNLRNGPGTGYDVLATLLANQNFTVVGRVADNSWLQLDNNGIVGWSSANYLQVSGDLNKIAVGGGGNVAPPTGPTGVRVRTFANVRVRSGPSTSTDIIDNLAFGSDVDVIGHTADSTWLKVSYGNGATGWIFSPYVRLISGSLTNVPVTG